MGKRHSVYSQNLLELREKEKQIQKDLEKGIHCVNPNMTLDGYFSEWLSVKKGIRDSTASVYNKLYKIYFCFGYTAFLSDVRYARHLGEVQWLSKIATEEREYGYTLEHYIEEFKRNKINFDGKNIPIFIDTIEQIKNKLGIK